MPELEFCRLTVDDLPLMHRWINTSLLQEIWSQGKAQTFEEIVAKYAPRIKGEEPTHPYLIRCEGAPIGYIQTYLWRDYPDYAEHLQLHEEAASLDVFIGEESYRSRGIGPQMLMQFIGEIIFANPAVDSCVITPEAANKAAIRAYEKAGFQHVKTFEHPDEPGPIYLMRIGRNELPSG